MEGAYYYLIKLIKNDSMSYMVGGSGPFSLMAQWLGRPPRDQEIVGSNPGQVIPSKTLKMVPDAAFFGE